MKVSKKQAAVNHERVLDVAAGLYREKGFDGIGVADIMKSAGLTHGGFYGHFASKEDLMAQVVARAQTNALEHWQGVGQDEDALAQITSTYLSTYHRDHPGVGCVFAALGADAARQSPLVRRALSPGLNGMVELLMRLLPGRSKAAKREKALATYAAMVGALVMSRAVDDEALSEEILHAVKTFISA